MIRGMYAAAQDRRRRPEVEILRDRVAELEETVAQLRDQLGATGVPFPFEWRLNSQQTAILRSLYKAGDNYRTREQLAHAARKGDLLSDSHLSELCCTLRAKLKPLGIEIKTVWGHGYYLPKESRQIIDNAMRGQSAA